MSIKKEESLGFPVKIIVFSEGVVRMVIEKVPKYGLYIYMLLYLQLKHGYFLKMISPTTPHAVTPSDDKWVLEIKEWRNIHVFWIGSRRV